MIGIAQCIKIATDYELNDRVSISEISFLTHIEKCSFCTAA